MEQCFFSIFLLYFCILCGVKIECNIKGSTGKPKPTTEVWKTPRAKVTTNAEWIQAAVDKHNYYRGLHQVPKLTLNNTLSEISQAYANFLLERGVESFQRGMDNIELFEHNTVVLDKESIGENLYYSISAGSPNASYPIRLWYEEIKDYDFDTGRRRTTSDLNAMIGHLTQLLWKSSVQIGTAFASTKLPKGRILTFVVANYFPRGNVLNGWGYREQQYLENVPPPLNGEGHVTSRPKVLPKSWPTLNKAEVTANDKWIQESVKAHNNFRALHGVPELKLNQTLCEIGQYWANFLVKQGVIHFNTHKNIQYYRQNEEATKKMIGENKMYFIGDGKVEAETVVSYWYQEIQFYDFAKGKRNTSSSKTASIEQFTQIVWKSATEVCTTYSSSKLENGQTLTFVVANYYPSKHAVAVTWEKNRINNVTPLLNGGHRYGYSPNNSPMWVWVPVIPVINTVIMLRSSCHPFI